MRQVFGKDQEGPDAEASNWASGATGSQVLTDISNGPAAQIASSAPVQSVLEASAPNSAGDGGKATDDQWSAAFGIGKIAVDAEQPVAPAVPKPSPKPKRPSPSEATVNTWGRPRQFRARKAAGMDALYRGMKGKHWRDMLNGLKPGAVLLDQKPLTLAGDSKMIGKCDVVMEVRVRGGDRSASGDERVRQFGAGRKLKLVSFDGKRKAVFEMLA